MSIFIAFIRGINVGGKNRIKMAELKHMLEASGLMGVETYIQSGNVIFESSEKGEILRKKIEDGLDKNFGISTLVILRTAGELEQLIQDCPFSKEEIEKAESLNSEGESMYVNLSVHAITQDTIEKLNGLKNTGEDFRIKNRDTYILLSHSIRNSKLANKLQKLDASSTMRNWKMLNKLIELVKKEFYL